MFFKQWYETPQGEARLLLERELLASEFPNLTMDFDTSNNVVVEGPVGPTANILSSYWVRIVYSRTYGTGRRPKVYLPFEALPAGLHHVHSDGELCIENGDFTSEHDILDTLTWTLGWLVLYEHYKATGQDW